MITLERALQLIRAGKEAADREGLALAFAVVDAGGLRRCASFLLESTPRAPLASLCSTPHVSSILDSPSSLRPE